MKLRTLILSSALFVAPLTLIAQTTPPTPPPAKAPTGKQIAERKTDQQERIGQGLKTGQLTPREAGRLEHQEAGINREERGMRAQDNGHLTKGDRKLLHHQQNQESRRIYKDKHNAAKR